MQFMQLHSKKITVQQVKRKQNGNRIHSDRVVWAGISN